MSQHELTVCRIDLDRRVVLRDGQELPLTVLEARFLDYLIARPGEAIPTAELLVEVWQYKPGLESKAVKKTVLRLRKKIEEDPANPSHIIAVRGVGYRFEWPDADPRRTPQAPLDSEADRVLESLFRDTPLEFPITLGRFTLEERVKGLPHKMTFHASLQEASSGFAKELQVQVFDFRTLSSAANGPVQKFIEAINRWALLKHSNIINVHESQHSSGFSVVATEWVDGVSAEQLFEACSPIHPSVVLDIGVQICAGLRYAHRQKFGSNEEPAVHGDLCLNNIILDWNGPIRLMNFGVGKPGVTAAAPNSSEAASKSNEAEDASQQSDLYQLASALFALTTGSRVSAHPSATSLEEALEDLDPGLRKLLTHCLSEDLDKRPESVKRLERALIRLQHRENTSGFTRTWLENLRRHGAGDLEYPTEWDITGTLTTMAWLTLDTGTATIPPEPIHSDPSQRLPALHEVASRLPIPSDLFIERTQEMQTLQSLLDQKSAVITVKGAPGTGKTRLCIEFARETLSQSSSRYSVLYCDFAEMEELSEVLDAITQCIGADGSNAILTQAPEAEIGDQLRTLGHALLILDHVDPFLEPITLWVTTWIRQAPKLRVLIAARATLRIRGEQVVHLQPLQTPDGNPDSLEACEKSAAVRLFVQSARKVNATFALNADNYEDIAAIVDALDGLPLAIELAAARVNTMTPSTILQRLTDRFRLLKANRRDIPSRQATLQNALDWSWNLLDAGEQIALAQCSLFRGGFTMPAAEAVLDLDGLDDPPWVIDLIGTLLDKSLFATQRVANEVRMYMYESIRVYAYSKLLEMHGLTGADEPFSQPGLANIRATHAAYYSQLGHSSTLAQLPSLKGIALRKKLVAEKDNLRLAFDCCLTNGNYDTALKVCLALLEVANLQGPYAASAALAQRLIDQINDTEFQHEAIADVLLRQGAMYHVGGKPHQAAKVLDDAMNLAFANQRPSLAGQALLTLASVRRTLGDSDHALSLAQRATEIFKEEGEQNSEAAAYGQMAIIRCEMGQREEAHHLYQSALRLFDITGNRAHQGIVLGNLAQLLIEQNDLHEAQVCCQRALLIHRETGFQRYEGRVLASQGVIAYLNNDLAAALDLYAMAITIHERVADYRFCASSLSNLALVQQELKEPEAYLHSLKRALSFYEDSNNRIGQLLVRLNLADFHAQLGQTTEASEYMKWLWNALKQPPKSTHLGSCHSIQAEIDAADGHLDKSREGFRVALAHLTESSNVFYLLEHLVRHSRVELQLGSETNARALLAQAESIAEQSAISSNHPTIRLLDAAKTALGF